MRPNPRLNMRKKSAALKPPHIITTVQNKFEYSMKIDFVLTGCIKNKWGICMHFRCFFLILHKILKIVVHLNKSVLIGT